ncbi:MAG: NADP-dependent phosphogluconate dehydrogenase [Planctomycetes bacterium]|nr:NADP-dependent phosphogluconate dehydrogenase [Planctomycetota bacterium]
MKQQFGVVGLGVMGANLALNIERNGFSVAVYNRSRDRTRALLEGDGRGRNLVGHPSLEALVGALETPRRLLLMVKAGAPVDELIAALELHFAPGDILIDGGNSHFADTDRRERALASRGIHFFGLGVSGGEEGALRGPSLMPGGDREAYRHLEPVLLKIAARADTGPCVTYVGAGSAGHFVKMVHNGIEYGDMQLIAEAYDLMRHALGMTTTEIAATLGEWNRGELASYLIEITAKVVDFPDDQGTGGPLIDRILDRAAQKGTGKWASAAALELDVPVPTITAAVDARILSAMKELRAAAAAAYAAGVKPAAVARPVALERLRAALYAAKISLYAQGFDLLRRADAEHDYGLLPAELARIWKAGCIIRARFLDRIREAFEREPDLEHLLLDATFRADVAERAEAWRQTVVLAVECGLPTPALAASLAYFDGFRRERAPANLIQAQRDFFGAHTYERLDRPGAFHTDWE